MTARGPLVFVSVVSLWAASALAATLCVNPGGTGGCFASVNDAIDAAQSQDVIDIAAGTYGHVVAEHEFRDLPLRLTLQGAGAGATIIEGSLGQPAFDMDGNRSEEWVVSGVTLQSSVIGLRIRGRSRLTLSQSVVAGNSQGGIRVEGGKLTVEDSTITGNTSPLSGAGMNVCCSPSRVKLLRSTVSGNTSASEGGAIAVVSRGFVQIEDSTISGNTALGDDESGGGGAIAVGIAGTTNRATRGKLIIRRSTIVDNVATAGSAEGLALGAFGSIRLDASIVQQCPLSSGMGRRVASSGFNLVVAVLPGDACAGGLRSTDLLGVDPMLGSLDDNGGPTLTHLPLAGSPALGVIALPFKCRAADQRGVPRSSPCDIGAVEVP